MGGGPVFFRCRGPISSLGLGHAALRFSCHQRATLLEIDLPHLKEQLEKHPRFVAGVLLTLLFATGTLLGVTIQASVHRQSASEERLRLVHEEAQARERILTRQLAGVVAEIELLSDAYRALSQDLRASAHRVAAGAAGDSVAAAFLSFADSIDAALQRAAITRSVAADLLAAQSDEVMGLDGRQLLAMVLLILFPFIFIAAGYQIGKTRRPKRDYGYTRPLRVVMDELHRSTGVLDEVYKHIDSRLSHLEHNMADLREEQHRKR